MNVLGTILEAKSKYHDDKDLEYLGREMFRMYAEKGFPPDMFLDLLSKRQPLDMLAKVFLVSEYQFAFLEHRRMSGIEDKRVDDIRKKNVENIKRLIETGELGIY